MDEKTHFAPAIRSSIEEIFKEHDLITTQKLFNEIFGAITGVSAILNKNRQIIYTNDDFLSLMGVKTLESILGKRVGEVVSCIHSSEEFSGCGTSTACKYCGAVNVILESQRTNQKSIREATISSEIDGKQISWDLNITSTPIELADQVFYVLTLQDISSEKRRMALERIFFHDLLNTAGGLNGLLTILKESEDPEEANDLIDRSEEASRMIIEEIMLHRQIRDAEKGDLRVSIESINSIDFLNSTLRIISFDQDGLKKQVGIDEQAANIEFETDRILLQRVIINLIKNALEASPSEEQISAGVENLGDKIRFWVKNIGVIPHDVQMQLFQRSFSTKGEGRGIGTYSIRLLTENYLKGRVSFISNEKDGTIFSIVLNKKFPGS